MVTLRSQGEQPLPAPSLPAATQCPERPLLPCPAGTASQLPATASSQSPRAWFEDWRGPEGSSLACNCKNTLQGFVTLSLKSSAERIKFQTRIVSIIGIKDGLVK